VASPKTLGGLHGLDRMVAIMDALMETPEATLAAISRATGLSEPTVHRYLGSLRRHGLVSRTAAGTYSLGLRLFELGYSALLGQPPAVVARPHLESLRDQFGETVVMAENEGTRLTLIAAAESLHGVSKGAKVGEPDFWHSTSLGKAILAELDPKRARVILEESQPTRFTSRTMTDIDEILASLGRVRANGFAMDDEESEVGLRCVGAAVRDAQGVPRFAISVSGPAYRITLDAVPEIATAIKAAASELSGALGCLGPAA